MGRALRARALTHAGEVFVPDAVGPLDRGEGRAVLAHELTHAVQQRVLGTPPPAGSAAGRALEAEAVRTERWFRAASRPPPLPHPPMPRLPPRRPAPDGPDAAAPSSGVQRMPLASWTAPTQGDVPATATAADLAPGSAPGGNDTAGNDTPWTAGDPPAAWRSAAPAAADTSADAAAGMAEPLRELVAHRDRLLALATRRVLDLDSAPALDDLATRLYGRVRSRLRAELLVDRERAGLLSDFR